MTFAEYFDKKVYKARIVSKQKSRLMKFLGLCLWLTNKLGITNIRNFDSYITTIGHTIYGPEAWLKSIPNNRVIMHELTHIVQHATHGLRYSLGYLLSSERRAYYESVCVQTEMIFNPPLAQPRALELRADFLTGYGCKYEVALKELKMRATEIECGRPQPCAQKVIEAHKRYRGR